MKNFSELKAKKKAIAKYKLGDVTAQHKQAIVHKKFKTTDLVKVAITNTGEWRFSIESTMSFVSNIVKPFKEKSFEVHVYCFFWRPPLMTKNIIKQVNLFKKIISKHVTNLEIIWVDESILKSKNNFELIKHEGRFKYFRIFKLLEYAYNHIINVNINFNFIMRCRNDLIFHNKVIIPKVIQDSACYIPPIEGHMQIPYNPLAVCNDQIALGNVEIMYHYYNLCSVPPEKIIDFEILTKTGESHRGIEGLLNEYLKANLIVKKNLNVIYTIQSQPRHKFKDFIIKITPRKLFNFGPYYLIHLTFRLLYKLLIKLKVPL
jgi:hypothetical protein